MVSGSAKSRRVAVLGSSRWYRTILESSSTSEGHSPSLVPICTARSAPTTLWSPPRPLPMSWTNAPRTNRSGRETLVVKALACTTVSTRCLSTVQMWTMSRGGRSRTGPHSGNSLPHSPVRSKASMVANAGRPDSSSTSRSLRASRGHGVRSSGADSAKRARVDAAIGRPVVADAAATRKISDGSRSGRASRASTTSPACSTTPSSIGRRTVRRSAEIPRRGMELAAARKPTSTE
ncbi:Uncharacterised protein [Mycobacteroides abscessus subsp. abscessus]|nr:Uncharacterised protein [Mycobacteroides abscessus subsp. abscessus]SIC97927.1 Uncharacterised protein [Mycobacteroides abscessus subsp. abscessus]